MKRAVLFTGNIRILLFWYVTFESVPWYLLLLMIFFVGVLTS